MSYGAASDTPYLLLEMCHKRGGPIVNHMSRVKGRANVIVKICFLLILFSPALSFALEDNKVSNGPSLRARVETLKLSELIDSALNKNSELKAMKAELESQKAKVGPAGALQDPMLSVQAMSLPNDSLRLDESDMSGIQVGISQKIPFPGKRSKEQEIVETKADAINKRLRQKELDTVRDVKAVYFGLYLKHQRKIIFDNQRTLLRQLLSSARSQYTVGKVTQASILNLQVEEATLYDEELRLETTIKDLEAELSHLVGHANHLLRARPEKLAPTKLNLAQWTEEEIALEVQANSAEIQAFQSDARAGESQVALAKKGYLPDFEVMANYTFRQPVRGMSATSGKDFVGAGVGISIPLWAGSKQSEQVRGAIAEKTKAEALLENARLMLSHQARALFAELKESRKRIDLFEGGLIQLTKQAVSSGRSAYLTGRLDYASLLESLRKQQNTEYGYQEALAMFEVQLAKLEALLGKKLGDKSHETAK